MRTPILFSLIFVAVMICLSGCKKKDNSINASKYIAKMVGRRLWSGTYQYKYPPDTSVQLANAIDTPYIIEQDGNSAVIAFGQVLTCSGVVDSTLTATFSYTDNSVNSLMTTYATLTYYYQNDSMEYDFSSYHHDLGSTTQLHTN